MQNSTSYALCSCDKQNETSLEDQTRCCTELEPCHALSVSKDVIDTDAAVSGTDKGDALREGHRRLCEDGDADKCDDLVFDEFSHSSSDGVDTQGPKEVEKVELVAAELRCDAAKIPEGDPHNYGASGGLQDEAQLAAVALADVPKSASEQSEAKHEAPEPKPKPKVTELSLTEIVLAERFAKEHSAKFRWSQGMDWMFDTGSHWVRDEHMNRCNAVKMMCKAASSMLPLKNRVSAAQKLCSAATINAVLNLARSEPGIVTPVSEWDKHLMFLNTPSGVYDLETSLPVSRDEDSGDDLLFTQVTSVSPTDMPTPVWDKFISEVFDNDVEMLEFIQRLAGYCLTGSIKEQKLFFMYGEGANGKSVLLEVLRAIGGKYSHNLPSEALMTAKHERHPTTLAALKGKRLAISSELEESAHWAEARIKQLTGDATLTARYMRGNEFTFDITHKHLLAGNFKPRLKGDDPAMIRRMVLIPFNQRFTGPRRDSQLPEKLKAEYPGILKWAIEGARRWAADGLRIPESVTNSSNEYMLEQNDIELWVSEFCIVGEGLRAKSSDLYADYAQWKVTNGEKADSSKLFSQRLERKFKKLPRSSAGMYFAGLQLKTWHAQNKYPSSYERMSRGY